MIRSGFIPRLLGILLLCAGAAYLAASFAALITPSYEHLVDPIAMTLEIGELPIVFWLLIWGVKTQRKRE